MLTAHCSLKCWVSENEKNFYFSIMFNIFHIGVRECRNCFSRDEYKNAEKDKKTEMALQFLEELQKDGLIQHYDYFEDNEMISYNHFNGALGGISFRDFNEKIDGLAMN